jgi:hypothetical protein
MSHLRPAWLTDDTEWQRQLHALPRDDRTWIEQQWDIAGGPPPAVDVSWVTTRPSEPDFEVVFFWWMTGGTWLLTAIGVLLMFTVAPDAINMALGCGIPAAILTVIAVVSTNSWRRQP